MANKILCFKLVICGIMIAFIFQDIRAQVSLDCNFNDGFCGWNQDVSDDIDWEIGKTEAGEYYIHVFVDESTNGRGQKARLISSRQKPGQSCLTFSYGMAGLFEGVLSVSMLYAGENENSIFTSKSGSDFNWWKRAVINLNSSLEYEVVIEGTRASYFENIVWLGNILFEHGFCTDCDFDSGFCYWTNYKYNIDWKLQKSQTGPTEDHTTGNGQYIYMNSTLSNGNDKAILIGPSQRPGKYCFSFWFYMHGGQVDRLGVWVLSEQLGTQNIRNITGSHAQKWIYDNNIIESTENFQIALEGQVKNGSGDIAIDDVILRSCQDCLDPSPQYGQVNATTFQYGSTLEITCDNGYKLTGSPFTECQPNGVWSNIPNCVLIEKDKSALIAIYVLVPVIVVASAIVFTIIFLRKRHPKCMTVMNSTNKSTKTHTLPYCNETYNGETRQGQIYANMSNAEEPNQSNEEYAIITDCSNDSVKYSNNGSSKNDDKHDYDHTNNAPKSIEDTTYSHISGNTSNHTDESSYDTTLNLNSGCLTLLANSANGDNCYNVINVTDNTKKAQTQATKLIEEPDYDHANAREPDTTSGDFDDYSHINSRERNANTQGMKSSTGYEQQDGQTPKYTAEKGKKIDEDRPYFILEAKEMSCGNCEEENHTYFVLEKPEN